MIRKSHGVAKLILIAGLSGASAVAFAGLKAKAPEGVSLGGTTWLIDPRRSDDPREVIEKAHERAAQEEAARASRRMDRGVFGDEDDTWGNPEPRGGTWGGGGRDDFPRAPGDGGWRTGRGGNSGTIDPTGGGGSVVLSTGSMSSAPRNLFLAQLDANPSKLSFLQGNQNLTVTEDALDTECAPGSKTPVSDSFGDGERVCGWDGRAWVVETRRGKEFKRVDRYEISKDGKTLTYVTTATGKRMPQVRISRTYTATPTRR
jgi:hypothetical protein